jgi:hypothetical protein
MLPLRLESPPRADVVLFDLGLESTWPLVALAPLLESLRLRRRSDFAYATDFTPFCPATTTRMRRES